jgi:hypothetical protein
MDDGISSKSYSKMKKVSEVEDTTTSEKKKIPNRLDTMVCIC